MNAKVLAKIATNKAMSAAALAEILVERTETRTRSRMRAYEAVAGQVGRSAQWLRKLISTGEGVVDVETKRRLDALLITSLEADIAKLQAELEVARASSVDFAENQVGQIEAFLAQAKALLPNNTGRHLGE